MAASSDVSVPTKSSEKRALGDEPLSNSASTAGEILQPQPPPCDSEVSVGAAAAPEAELVEAVGAGMGLTLASVGVQSSTPNPVRISSLSQRARPGGEMAEGSRSRTYRETVDVPHWV